MIINHEQWLKVELPFTRVTVTAKDWRPYHQEIVEKWLRAKIDPGWVYWDGRDNYTFESSDDAALFKLWVTGNPFKDDATEYV